MKKKRKIIDNMLAPSLEDFKSKNIRTKCLKCGFEEDVPDYIYDEFAIKKFHKEIGKRVSTLNCQPPCT